MPKEAPQESALFEDPERGIRISNREAVFPKGRYDLSAMVSVEVGRVMPIVWAGRLLLWLGLALVVLLWMIRSVFPLGTDLVTEIAIAAGTALAVGIALFWLGRPLAIRVGTSAGRPIALRTRNRELADKVVACLNRAMEARRTAPGPRK